MNITEYSNKGGRTVNQDYVIHRSLLLTLQYLF